MKTTKRIKAARLLQKMGGQLPDSFFVPKSYALTDKDIAIIASKIPVPIVEKIVEKTEVKTEVIRETPTITEVTKIVKEVDFDQLLEDLKPQILLWIMSKMNIGGGQANRNEQINSINVLRPFTDINWITGTGITMTAVPNQTTKYTDITVSSSGGSSGYQQPSSGVVDGSNQTFVWATAPNVIVVDQGRPMQKVSSDGTVNWTGTTTTTLTIAPNFDIFAVS